MTPNTFTPASWLNSYLELVSRFNTDVVNLPIPDKPSRINFQRKLWANNALMEELTEFMEANSLQDEADAMIDTAYFALGRLIEMGIVPGPIFEEVHRANMKKLQGKQLKRPNSKGYDAVKPEGWTPAELVPYLTVERSEFLEFFEAKLHTETVVENVTESHNALKDNNLALDTFQYPKLLIMGYSGHGKDTVAEMLKDEYGFTFTSSSRFCAQRIIWKAVKDPEMARKRYIHHKSPGAITARRLHDELTVMKKRYNSFEDCYRHRHDFRGVWYALIATYCANDKAKLAKEIFQENDIYVGIRSRLEFYGTINSGIVDHVIWIDADNQRGLESQTSCDVKPWMADYIISNNGTLQELRDNVNQVMGRLQIERI